MATGSMDARPGGAPRVRLGCLGCLGKMFLYLVGLLVLGSVLVLAIDAVFMPWSFNMGGSFHLIPMWRGWGKMHSASGGDYVLYVWFEPYHHSGRRGVSISSAGPEVVGWGTLCTPRGESYKLRVTGYMEKRIGASTDGIRMDMRVYRRPWYYSFAGRWDERPSLGFRGAWHNPDLVLDDGGSLEHAFNPDGTLRAGPTYFPVFSKPGVLLTLHEGNRDEFEAACREAQGY